VKTASFKQLTEMKTEDLSDHLGVKSVQDICIYFPKEGRENTVNINPVVKKNTYILPIRPPKGCLFHLTDDGLVIMARYPANFAGKDGGVVVRLLEWEEGKVPV